MSIKDIDTNTPTGRLLMAALAMLTTESRTHQAPDETLSDVIDLKNEMYKGVPYKNAWGAPIGTGIDFTKNAGPRDM